MKINRSWHLENKMPAHATLTQKIQWHADHARECGCRPIPQNILKKMHERKPKLVVGVLVRQKEKYLLVREKLEGGKEYWIIPGGKVEFGESIEEAAVREIKEETGIKLTKLDFLAYKEAIFPEYNYHTVIFFFGAESASRKTSADIEGKVIEAKWYSVREIGKLNLVESADWLFNKSGLIDRH